MKDDIVFFDIEKTEEITRLLFALSKNEINPENYIKELKQLYSNDARHLYSYVSSNLESIAESEDNEISVDNLPVNLENIINYMKKKDSNNNSNESKLILSIIKLYDHINLELIRYRYFKEINLKIKKLNEGTQAIDEKAEKIDKDIKNSKFDLIALTSLIFTAFTVVSLNATIFSALLDNASGFDKIITTLALMNILLISAVFSIYSIIRKVHGDISNCQLIITNTIMVAINIASICFVNFWLPKISGY